MPQASDNSLLVSAMQFHERGELARAEALYRQAITADRDCAQAWYQLGVLACQVHQPAAALELLRRAIELKPRWAGAWNNLAVALLACGRAEEALGASETALRYQEDLPEAHVHQGNALKDLGRLEEALEAYRQAMVHRPFFPEVHSNLLLAMHYRSMPPREIYQEHRRWNALYAKPLEQEQRPHLNPGDPGRRLRVAYLSPDLRDHVVARFLLPLLTHHDPGEVEIVCYADVAQPDAVTQMLMPLAHVWRSTAGLSDAALAELVRRDQVDVLVDLAGHTPGNRLLTLARRPAPVQVTYLGYPDTTGLDAVDYRLSDAAADPPGESDVFCSERLVRLPRTAWCYQPPQMPGLRRSTRQRGGEITFGNTSTFAKMGEDSLHLWARVLQRLPRARLKLKSASFASEAVCRRVHAFFAASRIAPQRVLLLGRAPSQQHFAWYDEVDVLLDSFPYHGTTTTCEALWMGVPVVTRCGETHAARVGASLLGSVGLGELAARSDEEYVQRASELAENRPRLEALHQTLRQRMQRSPLLDGAAMARDVEAAYRDMWRQWCRRS